MTSDDRLEDLFVKAIEFATTHRGQEIAPKDIGATDEEFKGLMDSLEHTVRSMAESGTG